MEIYEVLEYDPTSSTELRWLVATSPRVKIGHLVAKKQLHVFEDGMV